MSEGKKRIRVWADGCFDMVHFGHANALRQAKMLGDELYVGIHCDEEIMKHKGPPVYSETERYKMARAIRWVDKVIEEAPYITTVDTLDKYECDFCAHGDDITTSADGMDTYQPVKSAGRYKEFQRTVGISTTDLVGRMLLATKSHHKKDQAPDPSTKEVAGSLGSTSTSSTSDIVSVNCVIGSRNESPYTGTSCFLADTQRIIEFSEGKSPKPTDRIVYVDGTFDLFHAGHVDFLEKASQLGDYLIVGLYSDQTANKLKGMNYPIMNIYERTLSVLSCRYVNNVVMGAPFAVTENLLNHFKINVVAHGQIGKMKIDNSGDDPYEAAKTRGVFHIVDSANPLTTEGLIDRIIENRKLYEERNRKKQEKEINYIESNGLRT